MTTLDMDTDMPMEGSGISEVSPGGFSSSEGNRTRKQGQCGGSVVTTAARQSDLVVITCETSLFENF